MKDLLSKFHSFSNKRMKGNGLGDLKRFSCEALQHEYSSQFLSVDSTRSEDVFQTWVPQVLLIPWGHGRYLEELVSLQSLWISRWLRLLIMITEKVKLSAQDHLRNFWAYFLALPDQIKLGDWKSVLQTTPTTFSQNDNKDDNISTIRKWQETQRHKV